MTVVIVARHPSELLPPVSVDALVFDWDDVSVLRRRPGRGDNLSGALAVAHADGAQSRTDLLCEVIRHVHRLPTTVITARRHESFIKEMRDRRVDLGRSVIVRRAHDVPAELVSAARYGTQHSADLRRHGRRHLLRNHAGRVSNHRCQVAPVQTLERTL